MVTQKNNALSKTHLLVEAAIMVALSTALSLVKVWEMPLGGSITLLSMLPICMLSLRHGLKWGLGGAFVYAVGQLALGLSEVLSWGLTPTALVGTFFLDYIFAFTVLGLSGMFRERGFVGKMLGVALTIFLRFVCHYISGVIIFDIWMPEEWSNVHLYSICYNGAFMLPEMIITMLAAPGVVAAIDRIKSR